LLSKSGVCTQNPVNECNGDISPTTLLGHRQLSGFH
jgi:hypothetical protein